MGRYYTCASGNYDGKFWFGVQPSDDPETIFGLRDVTDDDDAQCQNYADYEGADQAKVRRELRKLFDTLEVPREKRVFKFDNSGQIGVYVWDELRGYYMTNKKSDDDREIPYAFGEETLYPISREKELAASRIELGLCILNEMRTQGRCSINAEF